MKTNRTKWLHLCLFEPAGCVFVCILIPYLNSSICATHSHPAPSIPSYLCLERERFFLERDRERERDLDRDRERDLLERLERLEERFFMSAASQEQTDQDTF